MKYIIPNITAVKNAGSFSSARHRNVICPAHIHYNAELVIVTDGTLTMQISGENYRISRGEAALILPFDVHSFHSAQPNSCHVLVFDPELVPPFWEMTRNKQVERRLFRLPEELQVHTDKILPLDINHPDRLHALSALYPLCCAACEQCAFSDTKGSYADVILRCIQLLYSKYEEDISLESVARELGVCPSTLSQNFHKITNTHFKQYLNTIRCSFSAKRLMQTDQPIIDIAYASGYTSLRSFNRNFRSIYGLTPTEMRSCAKSGSQIIDEAAPYPAPSENTSLR